MKERTVNEIAQENGEFLTRLESLPLTELARQVITENRLDVEGRHDKNASELMVERQHQKANWATNILVRRLGE